MIPRLIPRIRRAVRCSGLSLALSSALCAAVAAGTPAALAQTSAAVVPAAAAAAAAAPGLSAADEALLAPLAARKVSGHFTETRTVTGFPKPLVTTGRFALEGDRLVWEALEPFPSVMTITPEGVFIEAAGDTQALTAAEIPAVGRACALLTGVMGGRFAALADLFDLRVKGGAGRIAIAAEPRSPELRAVMTRIDATATDRLERLVMTGAAGDVTAVDFTDVRVER